MSSFLTAVAAPTTRSAPIPISAGGASAASASGAAIASGSSSYSDLTEGILSARSSVAEFEVPNVCGEDACNDQVGHAQLGYKDELEVRFIWDRVLGKGRHGTSTRVVIDRFTGQEYACKKMPKQVPRDLLPEKASSQEVADADSQQIDHIRREITLFTKLRSSLNVAKLEQVYEDAKNVYLVMEKCDGPTLAEVSEAGPVHEADVSTYMRSVVRTIVQCHDENEAHAGVEPYKFMLLTEDRQSTVKATGFGRHGGEFTCLTRFRSGCDRWHILQSKRTVHLKSSLSRRPLQKAVKHCSRDALKDAFGRREKCRYLGGRPDGSQTVDRVLPFR